MAFTEVANCRDTALPELNNKQLNLNILYEFIHKFPVMRNDFINNKRDIEGAVNSDQTTNMWRGGTGITTSLVTSSIHTILLQ